MGFANAGVTTNQRRALSSPTRACRRRSPTTPTLFPFPAAYSVFAGDCANNAPPPGITPDALSVLPGKLDHTVKVHVPALNLVTQINGANKPGMYVRVKSTTARLHAEDLLRRGPRTPTSASMIPGSRSAPTRSASTTASASTLATCAPASRRTVTLNALTRDGRRCSTCRPRSQCIGVLMTRVRDESGFTLIELLMAMTIGVVVLLAAFMLVDASAPLAQKTQDRVDAAQRGRLAMEIIGAELRSQVCMPGAVPPIMPTVSDGSNVWFYGNNQDQDSLPQRHHIYIQGTALREDTWQGTGSITQRHLPGASPRRRAPCSTRSPSCRACRSSASTGSTPTCPRRSTSRSPPR